jgi:phage tail sheath protein FI
MVMYDSKAPGVYIEEISGGARPIQAVGTSTAGFVGVAPHPKAETGKAIAVNNWLEFVRKFRVDVAGELEAAQNALAQAEAVTKRAQHKLDSADADHQASAKEAYEAAVTAQKEAAAAVQAAQGHQTAVKEAGGPSTNLVQAVYGFFLNGGTRCYVANVREASLHDGLDWLALRDEVAIVAAPGYTGDDYAAVLDHCERLGDRVAILDSPQEVEDTDDLTDATALRPRSSNYGSFYYPWITVRDPLSRDPLNDDPVAVPPSGHIAGVWARTDAERGVHKAPANTPVRGALGLVDLLADDEQGMLNQAGVNCIRFFSSDGILVWGARTLSSDPEWRYLNVRRLLNMIEESIETSTRWIVFEPNDAPLWAAIRRDVSAFLTRIWRTGALRGNTPEQAFFVKCDEETNPTENIDAGVVTTVVGVAPVKPAEFVVFQIRQYQPGSEVETQGG